MQFPDDDDVEGILSVEFPFDENNLVLNDPPDYSYYSDSPSPPASAHSFDESQALHASITNADVRTTVSVNEYDPSLVISQCIGDTHKFIQQNIGMDIRSLKYSSIHGLVILRLQDIGLIRKEPKEKRIVPHLIIVPCTDTFPQDHIDFANTIELLHQ